VSHTIRCPHCHGSKYEPSAATAILEWCRFCEGQGWFFGAPRRLTTVHEYIRAMQP
jgi:DnaJ-class molecular chaperone